MQDVDDVRMGELVHRFRNLLTITRSIVSQTLRNAASLEEARAVTDERLASLGGAVDLLFVNNWRSSSVEEVIGRALAPFDGYAARVHTEGPPVPVGTSATVTLNLAIHELATNAIKYGALSNSDGHVELTWKTVGEGDDAALWMQWAELDGPHVSPPERQGFGTKLICTSVSRGLRGRAELDYPESGVTWTLLAPLTAVGA